MEQDSAPTYRSPNPGNLATYGRYFWSAILPDGAQINFNADRVVVESGALVAYSKRKDGEEIAMLSLVVGYWTTFWAASMLDGHPVCVDKAWGWTP